MQELLDKILKQQKAINEKLSLILNKKEKKTWVSVRFITDMTGWSGNDLFFARKQKIIQFRKKESGGYEYLLESVPEQFLKKNNNDISVKAHT